MAKYRFHTCLAKYKPIIRVFMCQIGLYNYIKKARPFKYIFCVKLFVIRLYILQKADILVCHTLANGNKLKIASCGKHFDFTLCAFYIDHFWN